MPLYAGLSTLSQTAASNAADGSADAPSTIDQQTNLLASYTAQLRDGNGFTTGVGNLGQCRLTKSGANLLLSRFNGVGLTINGVACAIPSGGLTLAATSLTPGTTYYIYAVATGTAVSSIEASTTGHSTDTASGMEIKTGDASRTLVGMARPITGPAWQDTAAQRFVLSWFNQQPVQTAAFFSAGRTTASSGVFVELNTEIRNEFLAWGGSRALPFWSSGTVSNNTGGASCTSIMALDSTTAGVEGMNSAAMPSGINNQALPMSFSTVIAPSEGYHFITLLGAVSTGTGSWAGSAVVGNRCSVQGVIQG